MLHELEYGDAEIVIFDALNALGFQSESEVEEFLYRAKEIDNKKGIVVLFLCYVPTNSRRWIKRPMRQDLQFDFLFCLFDLSQS